MSGMEAQIHLAYLSLSFPPLLPPHPSSPPPLPDGYPAAYQLFMYTLQCYKPNVIGGTAKQVGGTRWAGTIHTSGWCQVYEVTGDQMGGTRWAGRFEGVVDWCCHCTFSPQLKANLEICLNFPREAIALLRSSLPLPECGQAVMLAHGFDGEAVPCIHEFLRLSQLLLTATLPSLPSSLLPGDGTSLPHTRQRAP